MIRLPVFYPIHKAPITGISHQICLRIYPVFKIFQNAGNGGQISSEQFPVSEILIMIINHINVINGERGDNLHKGGRRIAMDHAVWSASAVKIINRFSCQPVIIRYLIGQQGFYHSIHDILHLLIIRAIDIGIKHTAFQGANADLPHPV